MGKTTTASQARQQTSASNENKEEMESSATRAVAAEAASDDENCFLNPTLAAFNFGNLFYCNFCGFSANNTNKILHHLFIHVFKCSSCNHFTYTKYDLMKHIYKYHRPNKELKIKRLVLEVTSNDWYFLCSENEPHNLTSAINEDCDSNSGCFNVNSDYRSIDTSSLKSGIHQQHTRLIQSNQLYDIDKLESTTSSKSNKNDGNKKPATNFFLPKVQKSPEKLTQVIQSNRSSNNQFVFEMDSGSRNDTLNNSNTSENNSGMPGGNSQLKKLMGNKDSNPTSKIVIPTINNMKMANISQQQQQTNTAKQSSISSLMNSSSSPSQSNNKLMVFMESTASNSASSTSPLAGNKPKRQIRKPISVQDKLQMPKVIKKPKKCKISVLFFN